jgi:oxidase EvaA
MIIEVSEDLTIELLENFCWLTLGQIKRFLQNDNIVNMNTRTVLSCTQIRVI